MLGVFCNTNITWKTGDLLISRSFSTASTTFSKGRSWCSYASSVVAFTLWSNSRKDCSLSILLRNAILLTKKPTRPSNSCRVRFAIGLPTQISSWPEYRHSNTLNAASKVIYKVVPCVLLNFCNAVVISLSITKAFRAPSVL